MNSQAATSPLARLAVAANKGSGHYVRFAVPAAILAAFAGPLFITSTYTLQVLTLSFLNAAVVASLVISLGYTGLLNVSQGSFYGLGAYATAILVTDYGWNFFSAAMVAALVGALAGALLALTTTRVEGDYFVLVSLGLTIAVAQLLANLGDLTRGREGFFGLPEMDFLGIGFSGSVGPYFLCLGLLALTYLVVHRIGASAFGRAMLTVRFDQVAARSMAISPLRTRLCALTVSAGLAGFAGAFLVGTIQFITPADFDFDASFMFMLFVIVGGMANLPGAVAVAFLVSVLNEQFREFGDYRLGLLGALLIVAVFIRGGVIRDYAANIRERIGQRAGHARN